MTPIKSAFAEVTNDKDYLTFINVGTTPATITTPLSAMPTELYYTTESPIGGNTVNWTRVLSARTITFDSEIYFSAHTTGSRKSLYADNDLNNKWQITGDVAVSGSPNALLKDPGTEKAYTGPLDSAAFAAMFLGCSTLTGSVTLPSTTLASGAYMNMFNGCYSLTTPPALPATTLQLRCYMNMFYGCNAITTPPALPANVLATDCYRGMFAYCQGLTSAPTLAVTSLPSGCYQDMFDGCSSLKEPPALPATTLGESCYYRMFKASGIAISASAQAPYGRPWRIPTTGTAAAASGWNTEMFAGSAGSFTGSPTLNTTYYLKKKDQVTPSYYGALPSVCGESSTITLTGSLARAGYTVSASSNAVTVTAVSSDDTCVVHVVGKGGAQYQLTIIAKGNDDYNDSPAKTTTTVTLNKANQPSPGYEGAFPTAYDASAVITPTGSLAGAGYTFTVSTALTPVAIGYSNGDGSYTVAVKGDVGATYWVSIIAKGNDYYNASPTYMSDGITIVKADQSPSFTGNLPTAKGSSATITPTGSLANAGYTVVSSNTAVATVMPGPGASYTVRAVGNVGTTYYLTITALGNSNYNDTAYQTDTMTVTKASQEEPVMSGDLPSVYGDTKTITVSGSLAGAGYTVASSDENVATVEPGSSSGTYMVHAVGKGGSSYYLTITANGNADYDVSTPYTSATKTVAKATQPAPNLSDALPTAQGGTATITPTGSRAGAGYTVTSSNEAVATVAASSDHTTFMVQVVGQGGSSYYLTITANGNDYYQSSPEYTTADYTISKMSQNAPSFTGNLPTIYNDSAVITPSGSLANAGYTVVSSNTAVATVMPGPGAGYTVRAVGNVGASYTISVASKGNAAYNDSLDFTSDVKTIIQAEQSVPSLSGILPSTYRSSAVITPTGSKAGAGYTVVSSDEGAATVTDNGYGTYTVQVTGDIGSHYHLTITANGNTNYATSEAYTSDEQTIGKGIQPLPNIRETLPTSQDSVATIIPTGSLANAGYMVTSSDPEVALIIDNEDGSYTVKVVGKVGDTYRISIISLGDANYQDSATFFSNTQTISATSAGPAPVPSANQLKLRLPKTTYLYTGKPIKPLPLIVLNDTVLVKSKDYKLKASYKHNKQLGDHIAQAVYTVLPTSNGPFSGSISQSFKFSIALKTPSIKKVQRSKEAMKVTLQSKIKGATRYILYYSAKEKSGFKHKTLKAKGKTLTLKAKLSKKKYYVKVKAYAPKAYKKLTKQKAYKAKTAKTLKLSWKMSPYAGKYRIAYRIKGSHKWFYKSTSANKTSYGLKHLKKGKTYSLRVFYQTKAFKSDYALTKTAQLSDLMIS
jgi:cytochrome c-type biogenesis protein CcmE